MLTVIRPTSITQSDDVSLLLADWYAALDLRVQAGELAANSATAYKRGVGKFMTWCEAGKVDSVSPETLRSWKAALLSEGRRPATVNAWFAGIKALFSWAVETGPAIRLRQQPPVHLIHRGEIFPRAYQRSQPCHS